MKVKFSDLADLVAILYYEEADDEDVDDVDSFIDWLETNGGRTIEISVVER
jgi:hypothetical protein